MKKLKTMSIFVFLTFLFVNRYVQAQVNIGEKGTEISNLVRDFRLDFAVPDAPAFKLIDVNESKILRPTAVRELCLALSDFVDSENSLLTIPRAFAVELSPALLIAGKTLKLQRYQQNPWLYRLRISGATKREQGESGPSQIAFGLRLSLIDESDLRTDKDFIKQATKIADRINTIYTNARKRIGPPPSKIVLTPDEQEMADGLNKEFKDQKAEEKWNAEVLDIALALRAMVSDSLSKNLEMEEYSFWITYGRGLLKENGQWLLGGNAGFKRDSTGGDFKFDVSVASRIYIGVNKFKGFIEVQAFKVEGEDLDILFNSGAEAMIGKSTWLVFSAGAERNGETDNWNIVSNFKFKVGLPGVN
jgi:hypothetical protein